MLADRPVGFIYGVGPATQEKLAQRGFRIIADLQRADEIDLMKQFGGEGRRLWRLARGIDDRSVGAGSRRQDDFQRDHVRDRHPRFRHAGKDAVAAVARKCRRG